MNKGICDKCKEIVPVTHHQQDGKEYLHKHCPKCGVVATLVSNEAADYKRKRDFMADRDTSGCHMDCLDCVHKVPNIVFVETTNRCNMNCPICITNVPSMGFQFEPRMEFFERIFKYCSQLKHPPSIQLFGGEPTVREDMFEIINLAKSYGLIVRIATNGLKMADKAYAQKVIDTGATVLIAFDGFKKQMYTKLRAHPEALELKLKALENLSQHKNGKVVLMSVIDKQINGDEIPEFLKFCVNKPHIRGIYFMPLTHVWSQDKLEYQPERTTQEDIERLLDKAVGGGVEFVPMGSLEMNNIQKLLGHDVITFAGVHPNCESFTYLIPQKDTFVPVSRFLRHGFASSVADLRALDKKVAPYVSEKPASLYRKTWVYMNLFKVYLKNWNFSAMVEAKGFTAFFRWMRILFKLFILRRNFLEVARAETVFKNPNAVLEIIILPFEDHYTLESERLRLCASCFCYVDVRTDTIKSIPFCIWEKYKNIVMKDIAEKYNKEGYTQGLSRPKTQKKDNEKDKERVSL
jgi:7,8-dihydro-6-hydroxymethylpterin dimethyltransferase